MRIALSITFGAVLIAPYMRLITVTLHAPAALVQLIGGAK